MSCSAARSKLATLATCRDQRGTRHPAYNGWLCRYKSNTKAGTIPIGFRQGTTLLFAPRTHNSKVGGSNPPDATNEIRLRAIRYWTEAVWAYRQAFLIRIVTGVGLTCFLVSAAGYEIDTAFR